MKQSIVTLALAAGLLAKLLAGGMDPSKLPLADPDTIEPGKYAMHSSCAPSGSEKESGSDGWLRNLAKRWMALDTAPVALTVADFARLQKSADNDATSHKHNRAQLTLMDVHAGAIAVSEGDRVSLSGFLNRVDDGAVVESVNCGISKSKTKDGRDIHINIGPAPNGDEFAGVVVEIIPQLPVEDWPVKVAHANAKAALKRVMKAGLRVLAIGSLTYDNEHLVNAVKAHPKGGQPKRLSLWEVHPVLDLYVCPAGVCDPTAPHTKWQRLSDWAAANPK